MGKQGQDVKIKTPLFRVSFPQLWESKRYKEGALKWSVTMLFPENTDLTPLKRACKEAIVNRWGAEKAKWPANLALIDLKTYLSVSGKDGWPFRPGGCKSYDGYADTVFAKATSNDDGEHQPPVVVYPDLTPMTEPRNLYAGCWAEAIVLAHAFDDGDGNRGISLLVQSVHKVRDDEPFGGGRGNPQEDYDAIGAVQPDILTEFDEDIPF